MITEQLDLLRIELENQSVPPNWQICVISAMVRNPERIKLMMNWLFEHRNIDYTSMDLVNEVLKIKEIIPVEGEFSLNIK